MIEEWKVCPDFPRYEVSDLGRSRHRKKGNILKTRLSGEGYVEVDMGPVLGKHKKRTKRQVSRLVMNAFYQGRKWPPNAVIRYKDGDRTNCAFSNLYWDTRSNYVTEIWKKRKQVFAVSVKGVPIDGLGI